MKTYRGFQYQDMGITTEEGTLFKVVFPGGHKFSRVFANEAAVKAAIDELVSTHQG